MGPMIGLASSASKVVVQMLPSSFLTEEVSSGVISMIYVVAHPINQGGEPV